MRAALGNIMYSRPRIFSMDSMVDTLTPWAVPEDFPSYPVQYIRPDGVIRPQYCTQKRYLIGCLDKRPGFQVHFETHKLRE